MKSPQFKGTMAGLCVGFFYGIFALLELADQYSLWPLLVSTLGGAMAGYVTMRLRHWGERGAVWDYARWSASLAIAASVFIVPAASIGAVSLGVAGMLIGLAALFGLGIGATWRGDLKIGGF